MTITTKTCTSCGRNLHGRSDKKFCNDHCRNAHHNHLNSEGNNYVRNIDNRLKRNRRILQSVLNTRLVAKMHQAQLHSRGFTFSYCTHTQANRKGKVYRFCYEYGYLLLGNDRVLVTHKKQQE